MASVYGSQRDGSGRDDGRNIGDVEVDTLGLPIRATLTNGLHVELDFFRPAPDSDELSRAYEEFNAVIEEGTTWPFENRFESEAQFRSYFCSHAAFVLRANSAMAPAGEIVGFFYIKPNYPGRCAHFCNGGFVTVPAFRRQGAAILMTTHFLALAKTLGYRAVQFNLVFATNHASQCLWRRLRFREIGVLPRVGRLKLVDREKHDKQDQARHRFNARRWMLDGDCIFQDIKHSPNPTSLVDATMYYYDLTQHDPSTFKPLEMWQVRLQGARRLVARHALAAVCVSLLLMCRLRS
ncbi:L-azetidine-2-carboxylic acid acetyltransferase [Porphyridium purpureum]|uniref:L-azetidine-2-carboxylic acid acetyltransferase n=1 Tax=Porphyridium purpureum TaxID=35688 RepID=A0A5J4YJV4_PORPP|nr:L-azetidine-2-carboxylic acid acetyltransferase [Porphyridium purpureum]|eukprot:POR9575..scf246_12